MHGTNEPLIYNSSPQFELSTQDHFEILNFEFQKNAYDGGLTVPNISKLKVKAEPCMHICIMQGNYQTGLDSTTLFLEADSVCIQRKYAYNKALL